MPIPLLRLGFKRCDEKAFFITTPKSSPDSFCPESPAAKAVPPSLELWANANQGAVPGAPPGSGWVRLPARHKKGALCGPDLLEGGLLGAACLRSHECALSVSASRPCAAREEGGVGPARKRWAWTGLVGMISLERPAIFFPSCVWFLEEAGGVSAGESRSGQWELSGRAHLELRRGPTALRVAPNLCLGCAFPPPLIFFLTPPERAIVLFCWGFF